MRMRGYFMAYTPILNALNELAKDGLVFKKEQNCQGLSLLKIYIGRIF
jgi:hypothetical protein